MGTETAFEEDENNNLASEVTQTSETRMINAEQLEKVLLQGGTLTSDRDIPPSDKDILSPQGGVTPSDITYV